jgi:hypothetical protein
MIRNLRLQPLLLAGVVAALSQATAFGVELGLNFAATDPDAATSSLNAADVAGVVPQANWNNLTGATGANVGVLNYNNGGAAVASTASVTWSSPNTWRSGANNAIPAGPNRVLTSGYLDSTDTSAGGASVTVSNIDAALRSPGYNVYVYFVSDSPADRGGGYTINDGSGAQVKYGSTLATPASFIEDPGTDADASLDGTHLVFRNLTGASFTLTSDATLVTVGAGNGFRAPINAIQIVTVPEPGSMALVVSGGAALVGSVRSMRRRRK